MSSANKPRERVGKDLRSLTKDTRKLLESSARSIGGEVQAVGERLIDRLGSAGRSVRQGGRATRDAVKVGYDATSELVHQYPYPAIGIVFAIGLLIGLFFLRRRS